MRKSLYIIPILLLSVLIFLNAYNDKPMPMLFVEEVIRKDTVIYKKSDSTYLITDTMNLNGFNLILPDDVTLKFRGGDYFERLNNRL